MALHDGQPVLQEGAPLGTSPVAVIMVHGRNAGPGNILDLVPALGRPEITYLAPAAADRTWYPHSFMADIATNEPCDPSASGTARAIRCTRSKSGPTTPVGSSGNVTTWSRGTTST